MYAVVTSEKADIYVESAGNLGAALKRFSTLSDASAYAKAHANEYHYGVEIVDEEEWKIV